LKSPDIRIVFDNGEWINRYEKILNITDYLVYKDSELPEDVEVENQIREVFESLFGSEYESEYFVVKEQWSLEKAFDMSEYFNNSYIRKYRQLRKNIKDIFQNFNGNISGRNRYLHYTAINFIKQHKRELKTLYDTLNQDRFLKQVGKRAFKSSFDNYSKKVDEIEKLVENFTESIDWAGRRWQEFSIKKGNFDDLKKEMEELDKINSKKFLAKFFEVLDELIKLQEHFIYLSKNVTITKRHKIYWVSDELKLIKIYDKDLIEVVYVPDEGVKEQLLSA